MSEIVFVQNEAALTNSLLVAEKFKKEHSTVVRDIDNLIEKTQGLENECVANLSGHNGMFEAYHEDIPQPK